MKPLLCFILLVIFIPAFAPAENSQPVLMAEPIKRIYSREEVLKAIICVENGYPDSVVINHYEPAAGILHQWPCFVDDVNRIIGKVKYSYDDRLIPGKAIEMFYIYQRFYNPDLEFEKMCRIQVGGPEGMQRNCTLNYLELVKTKLYN